jgi:hypothetical protein
MRALRPTRSVRASWRCSSKQRKARENADRAVRTSQRLAAQLEESEKRVRILEAEMKRFEDRALRAERSLLDVQKVAEEHCGRVQEVFKTLRDASNLIDAVLQDQSTLDELH